eukprot:MONOS_15749.1-p1 / transcript=MONOS_15749.1 / gene=MONOS_15749 / organism=Monocercomonoides_exilis_PA203 / gene_product=unspecified product / transcript_product=unspecified product / location=Mono_scaffold01340:6231-7069(+) / protein_length=262 / sequence_SO=supercontig / SO=protein_coding / is_pseudo=false
MIEEKKISLKDSILMLKHMGYCKVLKIARNVNFQDSFLYTRLEMMIIEEEKKNEGRNEKLLVGLCECNFLLNNAVSEGLISICVPLLLNVASNKEENKEAQKEVEMALLALSNIPGCQKIEKEFFINEIKEIIQNQQEYRNLTHLAYQSSWKFLIDRYFNYESWKEVIVNELHFVREESKELEELSKSVDWKRKEEERGKEVKEALVIWRWFFVIGYCFEWCTLCCMEWEELIYSIVDMFQAAKDNHKDICNGCLGSLRRA